MYLGIDMSACEQAPSIHSIPRYARLIAFTQKREATDLVTSRKIHVYQSGIPTLALSKSGYRSKVLPYSQPVTQAPVCLYFIFL